MKHARTHRASPSLRLNPFAMPLAHARWALLPMALSPFLALANPTGGMVTAGQASISAASSLTTIQQHSASAVIDWQRFGIGQGESVQFIQPSASAAVLNRVIGGSPSEILGNLTANGRVFLVNPQGVMFGAGSRLDVGSLVASTLDISNKDFQAGRYVFTGARAPAAVSNDGVLTARDGGFVVLTGGNVRNGGLIQTQIGDLVLASGSGLTLDINDTGLVSYHIDAAALASAAGVVNTGELLADGGRVYMSAQLAQGLAATAVNNSGLVRATRIHEQDGVIVLEGLGGNTINSGTLDASSASGQGGTIQVLGDRDVLITGGSLNASGTTGGGQIRVGGGWQGGEGLVEAQRTAVVGTAGLHADALQDGEGGSIAVWSTDHTAVSGVISVLGAGAGNGGAVETSSRGYLDIRKTPSLAGGAAGGHGGQWLIDPYNITIGDSGEGAPSTHIDGVFSFTATGDDAFLDVDLVETALAESRGSVVTISTVGRNGQQAGNITLETALDYGGIGEGTLRLHAAGDIVLNGSIDAGYGYGILSKVPDLLNVELLADNSIAFNAAINTQGGNITATADHIYLGNAALNAGYDGDISLSAVGDVTTDGEQTFGNYGTGEAFTGRNIRISSSSGNIQLGEFADIAAYGRVQLDADQFLQLGSIHTYASDEVRPGSANGSVSLSAGTGINAHEIRTNASVYRLTADSNVASDAFADASVRAITQAGDIRINAISADAIISANSRSRSVGSSSGYPGDVTADASVRLQSMGPSERLGWMGFSASVTPSTITLQNIKTYADAAADPNEAGAAATAIASVQLENKGGGIEFTSAGITPCVLTYCITEIFPSYSSVDTVAHSYASGDASSDASVSLSTSGQYTGNIDLVGSPTPAPEQPYTISTWAGGYTNNESAPARLNGNVSLLALAADSNIESSNIHAYDSRVELAATGTIELGDAYLDGFQVSLEADVIDSDWASIEASGLSVIGREVHLSGASLAIGSYGENSRAVTDAPISANFNLPSALRAVAADLAPDSSRPNVFVDATEFLALGPIQGRADYVVLRAPLASFNDEFIGSISGSPNLFLQLSPTIADYSTDFVFNQALLGFAASAATLAIGSRQYAGDITILEPGAPPFMPLVTGLTIPKELPPPTDTSNYVFYTAGDTTGADPLDESTLGRVVVIGPPSSTPTTPAPAPAPVPVPNPDPTPTPSPTPQPTPDTPVPDQFAVLLKQQLGPSDKEDDTADPVAPIVRDSSGKAALQCDAAGLGE